MIAIQDLLRHTGGWLLAIPAVGVALGLHAHGRVRPGHALAAIAITAATAWFAPTYWCTDSQDSNPRWATPIGQWRPGTPTTDGWAPTTRVRGWPAPWHAPYQGEVDATFHPVPLVADVAFWLVVLALAVRRTQAEPTLRR